MKYIFTRERIDLYSCGVCDNILEVDPFAPSRPSYTWVLFKSLHKEMANPNNYNYEENMSWYKLSNGCHSIRTSGYQKGFITLDQILTLWNSFDNVPCGQLLMNMQWRIYHCMIMCHERYSLMVVERYGLENWSKTKDAHCDLLFLVFIYMRCHIT